MWIHVVNQPNKENVYHAHLESWHAGPDPRDRQCLFLRAEGLRYRDIARTLDLSLGGVAKSLGRTMTRLTNADEG